MLNRAGLGHEAQGVVATIHHHHVAGGVHREADRVMEARVGARPVPVAARKRKANESKQPGGGCAKKRRTEEANPAGAMKLERGKHLKEKPHMPQTARAGQKRWKDLLEKMRDEAKASTPNKEFSKQLAEV